MQLRQCPAAWLVIAGLCFATPAGIADLIVRELGQDNGNPEPYAVPYGFASEAMGFVAGIAGGIGGLPQPQNSFIATALVSDEDAAAVYAFFNDFQFSPIPRLFLDASIGLGDFPQQRAYLDLAAGDGDISAGSNDSAADDYLDAAGYSNWIELDFKYVFDVGHGRYNPVNIYTLSEGLLVGGASGGGVFNPFESGRTYLQLKLFHHDRDYDDVDPDSPLKTTGFGLAFRYDNTDFQINPSKGSTLRLELQHDPGSYRDNRWTAGEIEFDHYFSLSNGSNTEQRVIAVNAWTAHTFSDDPAPHYLGATLGGLYRLRAYPIERFHDNSAIYYSLEYRVIPDSSLLRRLVRFDFVNLQWWEIASFVELGRVAPEWDFETLHDSMKWDLGLSLRIMANNDIGRLDLAWSEDDAAVWLMYGHPF
jgi:hypothetical protein